jgi:O-6-methylguanine DNA methyltransferase
MRPRSICRSTFAPPRFNESVARAAADSGETREYAEVAKSIGRPRAVRAVARACATNPVAIVVPCHRVVPKAGGIGGLQVGDVCKERLPTEQRRAKKRTPKGTLGTFGTLGTLPHASI